MEQERALLGAELYRREYGAEFVSLEGGLFTDDEVASLRGDFAALSAPSLGDLSAPRRRHSTPRDAVRGFALPALN